MLINSTLIKDSEIIGISALYKTRPKGDNPINQLYYVLEYTVYTRSNAIIIRSDAYTTTPEDVAKANAFQREYVRAWKAVFPLVAGSVLHKQYDDQGVQLPAPEYPPYITNLEKSLDDYEKKKAAKA